MNLRDLQYLKAVAEQLHFGRAARAVNVSQPTLSMQLKKLEETLGVQLFERSNKQVMLTPIGRELAARAARIVHEAEELRRAAKAARGPEAGQLRLGIFPTLAPYLLPRLMPLLTSHFPRLTLELIEERTPTLLAQLHSGQLDVALLAMPVADTGLISAALFEEPFLLAVGRNQPLAKRKTVELSHLEDARMLLLEDGHCLRDQALEVCQLVGIGEASSYRATSLETLRHMVAASDAVTLIPKLATRDDDPLMRYVPFKAPAPSRKIGLIWRTTSARTPLFKAMAGAMVKALFTSNYSD